MTSGYSSKDPVVDAARFQGEGLNFRAKLIGSEDVPEARGDKMCQDSIQKLKAIVKASKEHKQKIIVNVSLEGLKIIDQLTSNVDHTHEVHKISFISRDMTDSRAFGYIYGAGDGSHKFFGIKTEKAAESLVLSLRDLFQAVYDLKKKEVEEAKKNKEQTTIILKDGEIGESDDSVYQVPQNGKPVEGTESEYASSPFQTPVRPAGLPVSSDPFANDPFSSGGSAQPNLFGASSGNPFGATPSSSTSAFPQSTPASNSSVGWPNESADILAPMKIAGEAEKETEAKKNTKDLFGDLCDIGSMAQVKKTPKDLFKEQTEPPKKSLNQLKAERDTQAANPTLGSPAFATPGSPLQSIAAIQPTAAADPFGLSSPAPVAQTTQDPFGSVPTTQQQASEIPAHDPFGPLSKEVTNIPDLASTSADPFDTSSILHLPSRKSHISSSSSNTQHSQEHNHQRPRPRAKKPDSILNGNSLKKMENLAIFSDNDFDLPSPEEPPPPLPSDALLNLSKNAPPPPPRPSAKKHPSPVPATRSSSFKTSLSVQSTQSGFSSSSEDQDNLSSLSPGSGTSSCDASPQPAVPRRTKISTPSDTPASLSTPTEKNPTPPVLHSSNHVANTNTAVHKPPVPKPRKSLSHKSSIGSADGDNIKVTSDPFLPDPFHTDPFATDPFPPIVTDIDFPCKDHNDNDPFLSSQTCGGQGDFESKWEAFDDMSSNNFNDKFSKLCNESQQNGNTNTSPFGDPF